MKLPEALRIIDISPSLSPKTAVFPGDVPLSRAVSLDFAGGHNLRLSSLTTTLHIGAHTDAPSHYHPDGRDISQQSLAVYLGPAQVMTVRVVPGARISPSDLPGAITAPRLLLRTGTFPDPNTWNGDFAALSPELVEFLSNQGVILVGIDTPSIDPANDELLESHQAVYRHGLAILEGIVLDGAPDGLYTLIALPLALEGADASPVRAVLLPADFPQISGRLIANL